MPDLLSGLQSALVRTTLVWLVPITIVSGLVSIFKNDFENWIVSKIRSILRPEPKHTTMVQEDLVLDAAPCCPQRRKPMVERHAKKGPKKDSRFWGCPAFPLLPWYSADRRLIHGVAFWSFFETHRAPQGAQAHATASSGFRIRRP